LPAVVLALDARCRIVGPAGERSVNAGQFFRGLFETALEANEILVALELATPPPGSGYSFIELARRRGDYALAGVAATVTVEDGRCSAARIALLSVGDGPVLAEAAAGVLVGELPGEAAIEAAADAAGREDIDPPSDIHASSDYRRHLVTVLTKRAVATALERAEHRTDA
jgi:CO/xanthine dehydrogenase FAD-binding subunit